MPAGSDDAWVDEAAAAIDRAEALLVCAGAGMGVDSGLPDFRGNEGFWNAYPPYRALGVSFVNMADPTWFQQDPHFAWGFYGHRRNLYRRTEPHAGFSILRRWGETMPGGYFVFTSNVDHQFQRAGYDPTRLTECHGSIEHLQCVAKCGIGIVPADEATVVVDPQTMRAADPLPACPRCGGLARPNILMFGDWHWDPRRCTEQDERREAWLRAQRERRLVVVECGAGTAIPTVRDTAESHARGPHTLVRLNPREPEVPSGQLGGAIGALAGLERIDARRSGPCRSTT